MYYTLNLAFDIDSDSGRFDAGPPQWFKRPNADSKWEPIPPGEALQKGDFVQFAAVPYSKGKPVPPNEITIKSVNIWAAFAKLENGENLTWLASPFKLATGKPQCIIGGAAKHWDENQSRAYYVVGTNPIAQIDRKSDGPTTLKFEFAVAAQVELASGQAEYSLDPEMDVDI